LFKFLHAADIHLDSPLRGLSRYEGAPAERIRGATRDALKGLVQAAIDEKVAFAVIAGDVFDGEWKDYNTGLFFAGQMSRLRKEGIRVYLLAGNHDAASTITKALQMPDNVHRFSTPRPETLFLKEINVALHGQGFSQRDIRENLVSNYPPAIPGLYNIGVLHTCADGREGHGQYAPCSKDDLISKNYDYWALGHVHRREIVHENPWIVFPGNIQGRHIRETGPKGCTLVSVDDEKETRLEVMDLDTVRWTHPVVDCSTAASCEEIMDAVNSCLISEVKNADERLLAVRLELEGACSPHSELTANPKKWINQIRAAATDISYGDVWIETVRFNTRLPADMAPIVSGSTPVGHLLEQIDHMISNQGCFFLACALQFPVVGRPLFCRQGVSLDLLLQRFIFAEQPVDDRILCIWLETLAGFFFHGEYDVAHAGNAHTGSEKALPHMAASRHNRLAARNKFCLVQTEQGGKHLPGHSPQIFVENRFRERVPGGSQEGVF